MAGTEDLGSLMEREGRKIQERQGYSHSNASTEDLEQPLLDHKPSDWRAPFIILAFECLESTAFFGVATNLVMYLTSVLHETNSASVTSVATWTGTSYLTPLLGAFIADSILGSYRTTFVSAVIYVSGMVIVALSALLPSLNPSSSGLVTLPSAATAQSIVLYVGLYFVAFGSGGVKSSLLPLGAEQFDDDNPADTERKAAFFSWFYVSLTFGMLTSGTIIVWVQENVSWVVGFGIAAACLAVALGLFTVATPLFRHRQPTGSPLKSVLQVMVASFKKMGLKVPSDASLLHEVAEKDQDSPGQQRLTHTQEFRFLDKAAVVEDIDEFYGSKNNSWRLCTVTQVEELKTLLRMVPIFLTSIIYTVAYSQMSTTIIEQGNTMDTMIGSFSIPPASLPAVEVIFVVFWTVFYDNVIVPAAGRYTGHPRGFSLLQRMGLGRFVIILAMAMTAFVETKRLESVRQNATMSILWQLPQYFLIGGSEALNYIGQIEFFYDQSPDSMKNMGTALYLLSISIGNYGSSMIVSLVQTFTAVGGRPGWIPDNLNEGHLDYYFWVLAGLCVLNLVVHVVCSKNYTLKKVV